MSNTTKNPKLYFIKGNPSKEFSKEVTEKFYQTVNKILMKVSPLSSSTNLEVQYLESNIPEEALFKKLSIQKDDIFILFSRGDRYLNYLINKLKVQKDRIIIIGPRKEYLKVNVKLVLKHTKDKTYDNNMDDESLKSHWTICKRMQKELYNALNSLIKSTKIQTDSKDSKDSKDDKSATVLQESIKTVNRVIFNTINVQDTEKDVLLNTKIFNEFKEIQSFTEFNSNILSFNHKDHTIVEGIMKINIPKINNYIKALSSVDDVRLNRILNHQILEQNKMLKSVCINARGLTMDELKKAYRLIRESLSLQDVDAVTNIMFENYSFFKTGLMKAINICTLVGIVKQNETLLKNIFLIYTIYVYSRMFYKYMMTCNNDTFNLAIEMAHKGSLYANAYKHGGHFKFIEYIAISELNKLIGFINTNKMNEVNYSRTFTYIKSRINQTLKNFSNNAYYKVLNDDTLNNTLSNNVIHNITNAIMRNHAQNVTITEETLRPVLYNIKNIKYSTELLNMIQEDFSNDSDFYRTLYINTLRALPFKDVNDVKMKLYTSLVISLVDDRFNKQYKHIIESINQFILIKMKKIHPNATFNKHIKELRLVFIRFLYMIYIKHAIS